MGENGVLSSIERDDSYRVLRVLADKPTGRTELVTLDGIAQTAASTQDTGTTNQATEGTSQVVANTRQGTDSHTISGSLLVRKRIPLKVANRDAWAKVQSIQSPSLPHIRETYELPDTLVIVYDYIEGMPLSDTVAAMGPLSPTQTRAVLTDVCHALGALHAQGIIHRDITPTNIILAQEGAYLIDFGIARIHNSEEKVDTTSLGTWGFAAPEQYGFAQTDVRSDIYSLGGLLGFMLTGLQPQDTQFESALQSLDSRVQVVIGKARSFEPSSRFANVDEFLAALDTTFSGAATFGAGGASTNVATTVTKQTSGPSSERLPFAVKNATFDPTLLGVPGTPRSSIFTRIKTSISTDVFAEKRFFPSRDELLASWREASLISKLLVVLVVLFGGVVLYSGVDGAIKVVLGSDNLGWRFAQALMSTIVVVVFTWVPLEIALLLLRAGVYQTSNNRLIMLILRSVVVGFVAFILLMVIASLAAILFGSLPTNSAIS